MDINNNFIVIENLDYDTVKSGFEDYFELYEKNFQDGTTFILYNSNEATVIQAPENIDDENFFFLANFMSLLKTDHPYYFRAYFKANDLKKLKGKQLNLYMDLDKTEYDDIFVVTEDNEHFQVDMGFRFKAISDEIVFSVPPVFENLVERDRFETKESSASVSLERNRTKRDKMFFIFTFILLATGNVFGHLYGLNLSVALILSMVLVAWWLTDYELFQNKSNYYRALYFSILYLCSIVLMPIGETIVKQEMKYWVMILPVVFLFVQYPARKVFIKRFNREPKVERPARTTEDFFYTASLLGFTALLTRLLYLLIMFFIRS